MESHRIGLTMLCSFLAALGLLMWQRKAAEPTSIGPPSAAAAYGRTRATEDSPFSRMQRPDAETPLPEAVVMKVTPTEAMSNDFAAPEMPIELHFRRRPDLNKVQGSLLNNSESELTVDALIFDPRTKQTSKIQLELAPYKAQPFGLDDGLDMLPGDEITLQSSPYRDKVSRIQ
jgi:hypothetical protein